MNGYPGHEHKLQCVLVAKRKRFQGKDKQAHFGKPILYEQ